MAIVDLGISDPSGIAYAIVAACREVQAEGGSIRADAAVRLMLPGEGSRLKAFVVPKPGVLDAAELQQQLRAWADAALTAPERPKAIRLGPALPRTAAGKLADWPLQD